MVFSCISCVKINPLEVENGNIVLGVNNVLICNEGGFQNGNASLSIYNKEENTITNDLYQSINNTNIGDILQSIAHINHELYLVVNNSQKIIILDDKNYEFKTEINGLTSPRYILPVNSNQAYVSDLYANKIYIIDINSKIVVNEINVSGWCEDMCLHNGKAYVVNRSNNLVYIINTSTNLILDRRNLCCFKCANSKSAVLSGTSIRYSVVFLLLSVLSLLLMVRFQSNASVNILPR